MPPLSRDGKFVRRHNGKVTSQPCLGGNVCVVLRSLIYKSSVEDGDEKLQRMIVVTRMFDKITNCCERARCSPEMYNIYIYDFITRRDVVV